MGPRDVDRLNLDVEVVGRGRDLVLLHSLLSDRSAYSDIAARLSPQRRLILVNLPGFGASPPAGPSVSDYAERVAETIRALELSDDADILGNGLGSFVAMSLALQATPHVGRLVLIGTGAAFPESGRATFRALADRVEAGTIKDVAQVAIARMFPEEFVAANPDIVGHREAVFNRIDPAVFAAACRALASLDLGPDLARIENPTLIVVGSKDMATPPALARDLASRLPSAELIELPGVGHAPHVQDPDALVAAIGPFLGLEPMADRR